jgi:hypothetical protein
MFLLALNLLSTLTSVLLDPLDLRVLVPHPVPDRTLFAVRLAHLGVHVAVLTGSFAAGGAVLASFRQPLHAALFVYPLVCGLAATTTTGVVALLFVALLRVVGPGRFQGVSLWVQAAGGVVLIGTMQLAPRLFDLDAMAAFLAEHPVLARGFPPLQYAAIYDLACGRAASGTAALLGLSTPILALAATFLLASRGFVAGLSAEIGVGPRRSRAWSRGPFGLLGRWTSRTRAELAGFGFAHALSRREPGFVRGALPQIVLYLCMGASNLFRSREDPTASAFATGILFFSLPMMLEFCQSSQHAEASWILDALPVQRSREVLHGAVRALLAGWMVPALLVLLALELALFPVASWPLVFLTAEIGLAASLFIVAMSDLPIPFTAPPRERRGCFQLPLLILQMVSVGILLGIAVAVDESPRLTRALLVAGAVLVVIGYRSLRWMRLRADPTAWQAASRGAS